LFLPLNPNDVYMKHHPKFALALFLTALIAVALIALMVYLYTAPHSLEDTKGLDHHSVYTLQSFFHNLVQSSQSFFSK